jgi:prepilin-type N-terminal cleavage/methylation domain-containing protein
MMLRSERGFTLPELLVAMVLTLTVLAAAGTALQDASRASEAGATMTDVNQNLRIGMNVLIKDLLQTGEGIPTGGIPIPSGAGAEPVARPGPVGSDWEFPAEWATLPAVSPGAGIGPLVNDVNTDAVTLLYSDHSITLTPPDPDDPTFVDYADDGSAFTFHSSIDLDDDATGLEVGDLIMFTNGLGNALQEVTGVSGQAVTFASTAPSKLNQRTAAAGTILQLRDLNGDFPSLTAKRIRMITYYLHVPTSGPITSPHFIRRVNYGDERIVAIGVENIQLTWDLVDGVTNPTNVEEPEDPYSPNQIRKANLFMAARSLEKFSRTDSYLRSSLVTQVSLRSMAFVSRYDLQ